MTPPPTTIAIVEDNAEICEGLGQLLADTAGFACLGAFRNVRTALRKIPELKPDIVIMDIGLPDGTGIQCTGELKRLMPELQIMMFTVYEDSDQIFQALAAGASGYLLKRVKPAVLINALKEMKAGGVPMSGEIARKVIASFRQPAASPKGETLSNLSPREFEVLEKLAEGLSSKELATQLFVSTDTINAHLKHIYQKLHVRSRVEAVVAFLKAKGAD